MIENRPRLNDPLWNRIKEYQIDDPHSMFPFSKKLAKAQNWDEPFTRRAIDEYKKFIYLCCISPHGASPSPIVDEVWHLHLTYTIDYWQRFCKEVLQREIHHQPSRGGPEEKHKHEDWYEDTLKLYKQTFGSDPPADIWQTAQQEIPTTTEPPGYNDRPFFELGTRKRYLLLLLPFIFIAIQFGQPFPYALRGPDFMWFFFLLAGAALLVQYISIKAKRKLLEQMLPEWLTDPEGYELSYLAGGQKRLVLHYITNLVEKGMITDRDFGYYDVNKDMLQWSYNPLSKSLQELDVANVKIDELIRLGQQHAEPYIDKYRWLEQRFNDATNNILLPLAVVFIGFLRCVQGMVNHRPVEYLVTAMIVFLVATVLLFRANNFNNTCKQVFWETTDYSQYLKDELDTMMVFTGFAAIAAIPEYRNLERRFGSSSGGSDTSGSCGSSCTSSCGSSCGGGCGGCGGGD